MRRSYIGPASRKGVRISDNRALTASSWLVPGLIAFLVGYYLPEATSLWIFGAFSIAFGVWAFVVHGGPQVTAAGMFCSGAAVFVGYAALWWYDYLHGMMVPRELVTVTQASYFATVLMYVIFWWDTRKPLPTAERDPEVARWATALGMGTTVVGLSLHPWVPVGLSFYTEGIAFIGIVMFCLGLTGSRGTINIIGIRALLAAALVIWFISVTFDGFGRLPILGLAAAVGIVFSARQRTHVIKLVAVVAVPVASEGLTALRYIVLNTTPTPENPQPDSDVTGLSTFAELTTRPDMLLGWGDTFWAAATIWVPRDFWPTKPLGFGTELTGLLRPESLSFGHSMVATAFGEWFWNFGWWGVPLMVVFVGWAIRWLDQRRNMAFGPLASRPSLLLAVLVVVAISTVTGFVWGGLHSFAARMLYRTGALVVLILVLGIDYRSRFPDRKRSGKRGFSNRAFSGP